MSLTFSIDEEALTDMVRIEGGSFRMGSDSHYPEEKPARPVTVDGFWIDLHTTTNAQFAAFAAATGYDSSQLHIRIPRKAVKGSWFLCAPSYCRRYRPAARHAQMIDTGMIHIGFRCIRRDA
jgi:formylglycine-generating enzyme required for sulfatase activity